MILRFDVLNMLNTVGVKLKLLNKVGGIIYLKRRDSFFLSHTIIILRSRIQKKGFPCLGERENHIIICSVDRKKLLFRFELIEIQ